MSNMEDSNEGKITFTFIVVNSCFLTFIKETSILLIRKGILMGSSCKMLPQFIMVIKIITLITHNCTEPPMSYLGG